MDENEEILKLQKEKEQADKRLLNLEIVLGFITSISFLIILFVSIYAMSELKIYVLPIILIEIDIVMFIVGIFFCLYIEQKAGYYECQKCHKKYVPTFNQTIWSMHICRTRYMKCPHCKQKSWNKKVLK